MKLQCQKLRSPGIRIGSPKKVDFIPKVSRVGMQIYPNHLTHTARLVITTCCMLRQQLEMAGHSYQMVCEGDCFEGQPVRLVYDLTVLQGHVAVAASISKVPHDRSPILGPCWAVRIIALLREV